MRVRIWPDGQQLAKWMMVVALVALSVQIGEGGSAWQAATNWGL